MNTEPTKKMGKPEMQFGMKELAEREAAKEALGLRALACKGFRWKEGMLGVSRVRAIWIRVVDPPMDDTTACFPDLSDAATVGCLLALVRKAWGEGVYLFPDGGWYVRGARLENGSTINLGICAKTEAEALVAALEVAQLEVAQ